MFSVKRFLPTALAAVLALSVVAVTTVQATPIGGNSVTVTSVTPGTATTRLGKAEDAAHTSGDVGVMPLGVRNDTLESLGGTDGDFVPTQFNADGALYSQITPSTTGGLSVYSNLDIDETTATTTQQMKASAGTLYSCLISNNTAATVEYVKFYNATALTGSAAGTETPVITLPIAGASTIVANFGPSGYSFGTGMTLAATTGIAVADTGAPAANAIVVNCFYK